MIYLKLNPYDYAYSYSEWEHIIDEWIFNEEDRRLFKRHYLDGISFDKLAEETNLSYDWVRKKVRKAKKKLIQHI